MIFNLRMRQLSIAICTFNRIDYLSICLDALSNQSVAQEEFEVWIVDNDSTDGTGQFVKEFSKNHPNFHYVKETKLGLSYARNKALSTINTEWIAFIDDDVVVDANYVRTIQTIIKKHEFVFFGGEIKPRYIGKKPKWIPADFNEFRILTSSNHVLNKGFIVGANMIMKRELVLSIGGFDVNLGMKGNVTGYGEEDQIQYLLREMHYEIGYFSELSVDHIVHKNKLLLKWHIQSSFAHGRDKAKNENDNLFLAVFLLIKSILGAFLKRFPEGLRLLITEKNYYWQNFFLYMFTPVFFRIGVISFFFNRLD